MAEGLQNVALYRNPNQNLQSSFNTDFILVGKTGEVYHCPENKVLHVFDL